MKIITTRSAKREISKINNILCSTPVQCTPNIDAVRIIILCRTTYRQTLGDDHIIKLLFGVPNQTHVK